MAGKPIRIPIISDVADFLRGTKDVEDALDDVVDSLDDVNDAGKDDAATEQMQDLEKAAEDAGDAADDLERKFRDAMDTVKKDADAAGKKVGKDLDDGFDKAKKGADDFKDEAGQSGREAAASFTGEFDDVQDFIQETAANAFGGFGPLGAAAGVAAAAGIGLIGSAFQKAQEEAEDLRELAGEIADQLRETGKIDLSDNVNEWLTENADQLEELERAAADAGVSMDDLLMAATGDPSAMDRVNEQWAAYQESVEKANGSGVAGHEILNDLVTEAQNVATATDLAAKKNDLWADSQQGMAEEADRLNEALKTQLDYLQKLREEATNAVQAQIDYQDQLTTTSEAIKTNGENWDISTQAGRDNQQAVLDLADEMNNLTTAQIDGGASLEDVNETLAEQKDRLYETAIQAGATKEEAQDFVDTVLKTPDEVGVEYKSNASQAQQDAEDVKDAVEEVPETRTITFNGQAFTYQFQQVVDTAAAGVRPPEIVARLRVGASTYE